MSNELRDITALSPFKRCDQCKGAGTVTKWRIGGTTTTTCDLCEGVGVERRVRIGHPGDGEGK